MAIAKHFFIEGVLFFCIKKQKIQQKRIDKNRKGEVLLS